VFGARVCRFRDSQSAVPGKARGGALGAGGGRVGFVCMQGQGGGVTGVSYRIRILMYFDVSCMYPDRILMCPVHIQDASRYNKIHILQIRTYLCIQLRYMYLIMYPSCIPHVSSMYPRTSADTCISYVSRMYPACTSHVHDTSCILICISYVSQNVSWTRSGYCKIHAKYQDTCILLECNRAFKIHLSITSKIHQDA
jgi:hypothetical protein